MTDHPSPKAPARDQQGARSALIVIDMVSRFNFEGAQALRPAALAAARTIARLKRDMTRHGCPTIYVNDNFGEWHSERSRLVEQALQDGGAIVQEIAPAEDDFFIIKPQFSGFYATNLPVLLPKLGVSRLVLTGIATDICVLFTAADAHMRDYDLWVPEDAVASANPERGQWALRLMEHSLGARVETSRAMPVQQWLDAADDTRA